MKRALMGLITLVAACSTPAADTGLFAVQGTEIDALAAGMDCSCFWQSYGYASESACRADLVVIIPPAIESCMIAVGEHYPEFEDLAQCRLIVASQRRDCYAVHAPVCDGPGFDACDEARDVAFYACPDPCAAKTGSARVDCDAARAQLQADSLACAGF